eukprot:TRINITY_DN9623_c0_g1_i1.p1 TRINITY_DN9623_c0_g1~~TRINITY_DN9623_c0_g1_i1.p1  ORF type:complete len:303 (-),score=67.63 TRINITY_DN9623_c0_g1_i1:721-1629(-)
MSGGFFASFFGSSSPPPSPRRSAAPKPPVSSPRQPASSVSTSSPASSTRSKFDRVPVSPRSHSSPPSSSSPSLAPPGEVVPPQPRRRTYQERLQELEEVLLAEVIDLPKLRSLAFAGLPEGRLRALTWKILLGYLPLRREDWPEELARHRSLYRDWHNDLDIDPFHQEEGSSGLVVDETPVTDDPLNTEKSSEWMGFFKDGAVMFEVEKDVHRTFPHLHFFQTRELDEVEDLSPQHERMLALKNPHYRAMRAILFMWAKLNPGVSYVQGMNELLGPIYYLFANDSDPDFKKHAEADAFFLLQ